MEDKLPAVMNARSGVRLCVCVWMASGCTRACTLVVYMEFNRTRENFRRERERRERDVGISNETDEGVFIAGTNNEICLLILQACLMIL